MILYIMKLKTNKYYIGVTYDLRKKFMEHIKKKIPWTTKFKPIGIIKVKQINYNNIDIINNKMNKYIKKYVKKFGIDNVRFDGAFNVKLLEKDIINIIN